MSLPGDSDLMVLARRVLLDALEALSDQRDALVLVGAQAIYLHARAAAIALPAMTKDSDLAIDRRRLSDRPLLEDAMSRAGFELGKDPRVLAIPGGHPRGSDAPREHVRPRRQARRSSAAHSNRATRRASGLEAAIVDRAPASIRALDSADRRSFTIEVAGPAALLVAKLHKLGDRDQLDPARLNDKDAHDVYRLLAVAQTDELSRTLKMLLATDPASEATDVALGYLNELFVGGPDALGSRMAGRAEELLGDPATVAQSVAALASDLARAVGR